MTSQQQRELAQLGEVEDLLERVEALAEPARDTALALVRALLRLYGEGLARITASGVRSGGEPLAAQWAADDLIAHLLLLHGLHPQGTPERVGRAVERARPLLHGARAELVEVSGGVARLRISDPAGCGSSGAASAAALDAVLEEAVRAAAPEVERVEVEHLARPANVIPLDSLRQRIGAAPQPSRTGPEPA
jgi:hypothetical protein